MSSTSDKKETKKRKRPTGPTSKAKKTTRKKTVVAKKSPSKKPAAKKKAKLSAEDKLILKFQRSLKKDPANEEAFVKLWDAQLVKENWQGMVEALQLRIKALTQVRDQIRALIKLGSLYDEKLSDPASAVEVFQSVLGLDPENRRAIWALSILYYDLEDWEKVIEVYLRQIDLAQSPEEKLAIRSQLAQVYEQCLQQEDQALMEYIRAARLAPQSVRILLNLEKLATRTESFRELLAVYEDVVERIERIELRVALYLKLARLYTHHMNDEEQTAGYYRRAVELAANQPELLFAISNIYGEEEEWDELIATYSELIRYVGSAEVKSRLRTEIARLYRDGLSDPEAAFFELVRVARYSPDDRDLIEELHAMGLQSGKHLELAAVLEDLGSRSENADLGAYLYTLLAKLQLEALDSIDPSRQAVERALELDPDHLPALQLRLDLIEHEGKSEELAAAIETFLERPQLPAQVAKDRRKQLARIYEDKIGDRDRAVHLFRQAMQAPEQVETPEQPGPREEILEDLYRRQGIWDELLQLLGQRLAETEDPEVAMATALEIAVIQEQKLARSDLAFFELIRTAKQFPGQARLTDALFDLAQRAGFATELVTVVDELLVDPNSKDAAPIFQRLGCLLDESDHRPEARQQFLRALELDPELETAYAGLEAMDASAAVEIPVDDFEPNPDEEITQVSEMPTPDPDRQESEIEPASDREVTAVEVAPQAEPEAEAEPEPEAEPEAEPEPEPEPEAEAESSFAEATEDRPEPMTEAESPFAEATEDREDRVGRDVGVDSSPMEEERTSPTNLADPVQSHWQQLRRHPEDAEGWDRLASMLCEQKDEELAFDALEEALGLVGEEELQTKLYRRLSLLAKNQSLLVRLAALLEKKGRTDDAESSYRSILRQNPAQADALDGLFRLYEARGSLERYDAILSRTLKAATDAETRKVILRRRAQLRAERLDRVPEACDDLQQLVSAEGGDADALALLEELLERSGRLDEVVKVYEVHLAHCENVETRVDLLMSLALLYDNQFNNPDLAIRYYRQALAENPRQMGAYDSLASLLEKRREWLEAIEVLEQAGEQIDEPEAKSRAYYRAGRILEEQLLRPEQAEASYHKALEIEAHSVESLDALRDMARRREDWVELIRLGNRRIEQTDDPKLRARLLVEMAKLWRENLENEEKADQSLEAAYQIDPDNLEAGQAVADSRLQAQSHQEAHELLAHLAELGTESDLAPEELGAIHAKLAQTAEALDRPEEASQSFERSLRFDPTNHKVLTQFGYHLARQEKWDRAVELYQEILNHQAMQLDPSELAELHCLAGQGLLKQDRPEEAVRHYQKALKVNPRHLPALRANIDLARRLQQHGELVDLLARLRDLSADPSARHNLSMQIADILATHLNRPQDAAQTFRQALAQEPNNIELLEKLRRVLVRTENYAEAVQILDRLAYLAATDRQRARYLRIAGDIEAERLDDDRKALAYYLQALRSAPLDKRAHGSTVKILSRMRDWPRLTGLYNDLLKRLPPPIAGQADRRLPILTELVELYRYRLNDQQAAIQACEQFLAIAPSDLKIREDLARLYEKEKRQSDAIMTHRELIAESPFSVDSYRALRRIYQHQGHRDRTLCLAAALGFLDEANEDELALLNTHRHALALPPGRHIDEATYSELVLYPTASGPLGEIFSFAADHCRSLFVVDHRELRLKAKDRLRLEDRSSKVAGTLRAALSLLGLPEPEIYGKGANIKGIMAVNTSPTAILFNQEAVRRASIAELRFMVGRAVAFTRPENVLAASLTPKQLRLLLQALVVLVFPGDQIHAIDAEVAVLARKLDKLIPRGRQNRLRQLAGEYRDQAEDLSIRDWLEGVEHTCNRVGFAFSGDLEAAVQVLKGARVVSPSGSSRSLIRELIFYSIAEDYFQLREKLDAAIV